MIKTLSVFSVAVVVVAVLIQWDATCEVGWHEFGECVPDAAEPWPWREGSDALNREKDRSPMAGAMLYAYFRNDGDSPVRLDALAWDGTDVADLHARHEAVWWRLSPREVAPGGVGEIAFRRRAPLDAPGELSATLSDGRTRTFRIGPEESPFRLQSVGYAPDRSTVYLYIEHNRPDAPLPEVVWIDGRLPQGNTRWLSDGYVGRLRVGVIELETPLDEGAWTVWTVSGDGATTGAALRVVSQPARFGSYGGGAVERMASEGLDGYVGFHRLSREWYDAAQAAGVVGTTHISGGEPPEDVRGHPAVYGYCLIDEPDVHDYGYQDRPMRDRIGALAQKLVGQAQRSAELDPAKPAIINLNLTFTPANYYVYGPIPDLTTGDCYPITVGKSLTFIRDCVTTLKRAAAPRPTGFVYQGSWEHFSRGVDRYVGGAELRKMGYKPFADPDRTRGLGRPPFPDEVRIQMAYCVGAGARALWSYIDSTEASGGLVIIGSDDLPDIRTAIALMSRTFRSVASDINLSHPISWARSDSGVLWMRTLVCGESAALVVVVNEDCVSDADGFRVTHAQDVVFEFPDLPWLEAHRVEWLRHDGTNPVVVERTESGARWRVMSIRDIAVFRVSAD